MVLMWNASTVAGYLLGGFIAEPEKYALDFAFTAIFLALAFLMFRGKESLLPWTIAAVVASVAEAVIPGKFYIVLGALAGALSAAFLGKNNG
ncbi:MAG: hypothetical protein IBX45_10480 [Campylobacterales bacterium]|nr:hypothetical protein [Campylobacterales bacterium]